MREAYGVFLRLHELELRPPGRGEPDVKVTLDRADLPARLLDDRHRRPILALLHQLLEFLQLDLERVVSQADARQHGQLLDRRHPVLAAERRPRGEVPVDNRLLPGLEQAKPQLGPVNAAGVQLVVTGVARDVDQQAGPMQLPSDLQVQRCLGHIGRLNDPVDALLIFDRILALDIVERCLFTQRFQLDQRRFGTPERIVRPGRDDQRQFLLVGLTDRQTDEVVPFRFRRWFDQGLL